MAAAPAEVPTPLALANPDLPPAKRKKEDNSCLEISPVVVPATDTETVGWESLPADLVRRIADSFLPTNDVDCYMNMRAVCPTWRAATNNPWENASDVRFHPRRWIVLDEVFHSKDNDRWILLNTATGRFLHKKLALLGCSVVATTDGFLILADKSPPHAARVYNTLTGYTVPFAAPVPLEARVAYVASSDKPSLVLLGDSSRKLYEAVPESKDFDTHKRIPKGVYNFHRKAVVSGAYTQFNVPDLGRAIAPLLKDYHGDPARCFSIDLPRDGEDLRCFLVGLDGEVLAVMIAYRRPLFPLVFKMNTETEKLETVQNIGRFAIFIGHQRCLAIDADKLPGIEANCVYYTERLNLSAHICKYNCKDKNVERISEAAEFVKQHKKFVLLAHRPFTIIQLLCSYTINIPDSQLALQQMS
uniref:Uncharacterized protein n=1 Tax=Avena sativa TaxID=4498 RepID=A0ACD5VTB5_AVESA